MDLSKLFTLDFGVVFVYLAITLYIGMRASKGITTMRDYVLGERDGYATPILVATFFATEAGSGTIMGTAEKVFIGGIIWGFARMGRSISFFAMARYIAPYMDRFHGKLSLGEMMGNFYGKPGQVLGALAGIARCVGAVGAQIAAVGYLFHYFMGLPYVWGVAIAYGIVVAYSAFGGIRAVTATDIIQFGILVIAIPMIACKMLWHAGGYQGMYNNIPQGHFDFLARHDLWKYIFLFCLFSIPELNPAIMQRLLMAKDAKQAYDCLNTSACLRFLLDALVILTAFATVAVKPNLNPSLVFPYAIDTVLSVGFRGIGIAGLFAVVMSSADSYLHAGSVSLLHDVVQPLRTQRLPNDKELKWTRFATALLGVGAAWAALKFRNILDLVLVFKSLWMPIVLVPLFAGMWGYSASIRSFCVAATAGVVTVGLWKLGISQYMPMGPTIPAMIVNLLVFCIMRLFDGPHNIHYDPDDPYVQALKEKEQDDIKRDTKAGKTTGIQQRLGCWFAQWQQWLVNLVPSWKGVVAFCNLRAKILNFSYIVFAILTMICAGAPYFSWVNLNTAWEGCVFWMRLSSGMACFLVLMRNYLPWKLLHKHLPVFWVGTLGFAWPFTQTFAFLSEGGSTGSFLLWVWGTCMLIVRLDMQAARRVILWGTLLGLLFYNATDGATGVFEALAATPMELLLLSPVLIVSIALLPRRDEMMLRTQNIVLSIQQSTSAHEAKRPLMFTRDEASLLQKNVDKLFNMLKQLKQILPREQNQLQQLCKAMKTGTDTIKQTCQEGIDFLGELISQTKDPLQYTPKCQVVNMKDCIDLAMRTGNFSGHRARIHVNTKENFEVMGNMGLLAHLVVNATENAVKNSGPNDRINIQLHHRQGRNTISIYNTSSNTLEQNVLHVFDLDFTRTQGGTGTGLAFSKWAVEQMDGEARVWSMPGKSTCFEYDFPEVTAQVRQQAQQQDQEQDWSKKLDEALKKQEIAQQEKWANA